MSGIDPEKQYERRSSLGEGLASTNKLEGRIVSSRPAVGALGEIRQRGIAMPTLPQAAPCKRRPLNTHGDPA